MAKVKDNVTGQIFHVPDEQLGQYGLSTPVAQPVQYQQPQQTQASPDFTSNIGNFLINLAKNMVKPTTDTVNDIIKNPSKYQKNAADYLGAIGGPLGGLLAGGNQAQKLLPAELNTSSFAVPFSKGAGLISGAVLPGAAVGAMQRAAEPGANASNLLGAATLGGAGAGVLNGVLGLAPKAAQTTGNALDSAGNNLLRTQYNILPKTAEKLNANQTIGQLADYGFKNINDVQKAAQAVTGDTGIITKLTRKAVEKANPVDMGGVLDAANQYIASEPLISQGVGDKFVAMVRKGIGASTEGNISFADPSRTFDFIQELESKAATLSKKGASDEAQALAGSYKGVANELKDRLFQGSGADNALVSNILTPDMIQQINQISPRLGQQISSVQNVGQLRSLAAPFVRGSQLAQETMNREGNKLLNLGDIATGVGGIAATGGPQGLAFLGVKKLIDTPMGKTAIANTLQGAGGLMGKASASQLNPLLSNILSQGAARSSDLISPTTLPNQIENISNSKQSNINNNHILPPTAGMGGNISNNTQNTNNGSYNESSQNNPTGNLNHGSQYTTQNKGNQITPEMVAAAQLYLPPQLSERVKAAYQSQYGSATTQQVGLVKSGLKNIDDVEQMLKEDPTLLAKQLIPGKLASRKFDSAIYDAADSLLRLRTGAQANPAEIKAYAQSIAPSFGDSPDAVAYKIAKLRSDLQSYLGQ